MTQICVDRPAPTRARAGVLFSHAGSACAVLIALAASVGTGGCANQAAQYAPTSFVESGAPVAADQAVTDQSISHETSRGSAASDWAERTYVYRGGRDPKTGRARMQL